jgi:3-phosphoshikimate 1-carboxyvinyltransferase
VKSAILLAGLHAAGETTVIEKEATRDHTERMLRWLGVDVRENRVTEGKRIVVSGGSRPSAHDIAVPADLSSAAFFMVAAGFLDGSEISLPGVGINDSRRAVADVLMKMGVDIEVSDQRDQSGEPVADLVVRGTSPLTGRSITKLSGGVIANLIDEIPILAVAGTRLEGGIEIRDAAELRIKESDRIAAVVENLRRMGGSVEEFQDGIRVERSNLRGAVVDSFGDHRIAMAFAVAGLFADGETDIVNAECAAVSFPAFFDELARVIY